MVNYAPLKDAFSELFKKIDSKSEDRVKEERKYQKGTPAYLGYSDTLGVTQIKVSGRPRWVYIRVKNAKGVETKAQAMNQNVPLIPGIPISVRKISEDQNRYLILGVNNDEIDDFMKNYETSLNVGPHSHRIGLGNVDLVETERIEAGILSLAGGMNVHIGEFRYFDMAGIDQTFMGGDFTLIQPPSPGTAFNLQLIIFNREDGTFEQLHGGGMSKAEDITRDMFDDIAISEREKKIPIGGVKLSGTASSIDSARYLLDPKFWIGGYIPSSGTVGNRQLLVNFSGNLSVGAGPFKIYNSMDSDKLIERVFLSVSTAPATQKIIVDVNVGGVTAFTNQANRPEIAVAAVVGETIAIDSPDWPQDDYITVDIDQVGTGTAGANLTVHIVFSDN